VAVRDDPRQASAAEAALAAASLIAVPNATLCELVWVLGRLYRRNVASIAATIRGILNSANVVCDRQAVEAGLAMLDAGGDFADGVMAYEGLALGADEFVSFDKTAVAQLRRRGLKARALR